MSQSYLYLSSGRIQKEYEEAVKKSSRNQVAERLMNGEAGLFTRQANVKKIITNRLGWVDIAGKMKRRLPEIEKFGKDVLKSNIKHVVISGMGGSSLCPDLFKLIFDKHPKLYSFDVLDSTDPTAIVGITNKIDLKRTLFIIASKSGSTIETYSHMIYFIDLLEKNKIKNIGDHFAAITDKGSALEKFGRKNKFRKIFINPSDIGGRYSALSYFGLVPGFFAGVDLKVFLDSAISMGKIIKERQGETNPAIVLGSLMASASSKGIDKLTFIASKNIAPLVPWIEQLIAESTGKNGKGVIPIEAEPVGNIAEYSKDRLFLFLRLTKKKTDGLEKLKAQLIHKKYPIVQLNMNSVDDLGAQFILWEAATAIAGYHLNINPFDEPNVSESKANTSAILNAYQESGCFHDNPPTASYKNLNLIAHSGKKYSSADVRDVRKVLKQFFASLKKTKYCTILNYFNADNKTEKILSDIREQIRKQKNTATLRGYGPLYLHSVGQLYKGGPAKGCFIIFVRESYTQLEIPGKFYDFGQLISAQAVGDARALASRNLPMLVFSIKGSPSAGLKEFSKLINQALK
ncbi:MAG: hypothetical protein ABIJ12_13510 [bacterium]